VILDNQTFNGWFSRQGDLSGCRRKTQPGNRHAETRGHSKMSSQFGCLEREKKNEQLRHTSPANGEPATA
jgi:hypothetical protein